MKDATERRDICVGDYIIYAVSAGRNAMLRFGRVTATDGEHIEIQGVRKQHSYLTGSEFRAMKSDIRLATGWNKLVVPKEALPEEVQYLLDEKEKNCV